MSTNSIIEECVDGSVGADNATGDNANTGNNANIGDNANAGNADAGGAAGNATGGANINGFAGNVGAAPVPILNDPTTDRPFSVNGATFLNAGAAIQRACDVQKNACANAANSGAAAGDSISVSDCDAQQQQCVQANAAVAKRGIAGLRARQAIRARLPA